MNQALDSGLAMVAWTVAGALALAAGGAAVAFAAHRRRKQAEAQLRTLESAISDFCSALHARVAAERRHGRDPDAPSPPSAAEAEVAIVRPDLPR